MIQTEAVVLVANLNRAGLLHAMEGQSEVWLDALHDLPFEDAREAARRLIRTRTRGPVTPADIREGVRAIRRERTEHVVPPPPPSELTDDVGGTLRWQRAYMRAMGDGSTHDQARASADAAVGLRPHPAVESPRPVADLVDRTEKALPRIPYRKDPS